MSKTVKKSYQYRNQYAVAAFQHGGAGKHPSKKKEASKRACRGKVER